MLEALMTNKLEYKKLSKEEMERRGILGRLVGVIADTTEPTRNGRQYTKELWEKAFNNPILKEKIQNKVCFCELGHPEGRLEIDMERACAQLAEVPKIGPDGKLRAVFDILSTPCGQILNTVCKYGSTVGVSSRGEGDLITDRFGNETVDPDTYNCETLDIVVVPAVKSARLQYVNESLETGSKKTLQESLHDLVENASIEDRITMESSLKDLGLVFLNESVITEEEEQEMKDDYDGYRKKEAEKQLQILNELDDEPADEEATDNDDAIDDIEWAGKKVDEGFDYEVTPDGEKPRESTRKRVLSGVYKGEEKEEREKNLQEVEDKAILKGKAKDESDDGEVKLTVKYKQEDDLSDQNIKDVIRELVVKTAEKNGFNQKVDYRDEGLTIRLTDYGTDKDFNRHLSKIVDGLQRVFGLNVKIDGYKGTIKLSNDDIDDLRKNAAGDKYTDKMYNGEVKDNNTSGITGVSQEADTGMWRAYITVDGKKVVIGHYADKKDAKKARERAATIAQNSGLSKEEKIEKIKAIEIDEDLSPAVSALKELDECEGNNSEKIPVKQSSSDEGVDIIEAISEPKEASNVGADLVTELQEALIENSSLKRTIRELQEKLSVGYTKDVDSKDQINRYKRVIQDLTESNRQIAPLKSKVETLSSRLEERGKRCAELESVARKLSERYKSVVSQKEQLSESLMQRESDIKALNSKIDSLNGDIQKLSNDSDNKEKELRENLLSSTRE